MRERKIPTLIGLLLVGTVVFTVRFAFNQVSPLLTKASETTTPKEVTITNVSDTAFTVSWMTSTPTTGSVRLEGKLPATMYYDERINLSASSPSSPAQSYTTHMVTLRSLKPETTYTFRILSNGKSFQNHAKPYEARTAPQLASLGTAIEPAYGQVTNPSGEPAEGAIVELTLSGGQPLTTLTKSGGTWVIPLNRARTDDLSAYIAAGDRIDETIVVRSSEGEAHATTDTLNDNPVPVITIGKTYDFRKIQAENGKSQPLAQTPPNVLGSSTQPASGAVSITKPAQGSAIPSNLPLIQGTGVPGNQVLIIVGITNPVSDTFLVGEDGVWRYTPPKPLAEGKQSVTITTSDAKNKTVAITNLFEVLKSGTQVLGDATPSASLTPEPTVAGEPAPTATLAGDPLPESGFPLPLIILLILGFGLITSGTLLFNVKTT